MKAILPAGQSVAESGSLLGMSPFPLHRMAGNIWQWCRDWYDEGFYQKAEARRANPVNRTPTLVRSERGGIGLARPLCAGVLSAEGVRPLLGGAALGFVVSVQPSSGS